MKWPTNHKIYPGRGNSRLTYQAECGQLVGLWLLELCGKETAAGCCGYNFLCVMAVSQLTDKINKLLQNKPTVY
jgi:hypothetical protein